MRRFALAALVLALAVSGARAQAIALTFDDLPAHNVLPLGETRIEVAKSILKALKAEHVPPVHGFVNGLRIDQEPSSGEVLSLWRAAGYPLGNHTWSHLNLNAATAEQFEADLARNEPLLAGLPGNSDWRWLRFPFLAEGDTPQKRAEVRAFLAGRGYRIASVTLNFDDYAYNEPYARCVAKDDQGAIANLEARYLDAAKASLAYERGLSHALFGRDIPYVLLMHIGAFDARIAPRLLALYRAQGVRFVSLPDAERDRFYRPDTMLSPSDAPTNLEGEMIRRGRLLPARSWSTDGLEAVCR